MKIDLKSKSLVIEWFQIKITNKKNDFKSWFQITWFQILPNTVNSHISQDADTMTNTFISKKYQKNTTKRVNLFDRRVKNDASARSPNLTSPSRLMRLTFDFLTPKSIFISLLHRPLVPICRKIRSFLFKITRLQDWQRTDGRTIEQTDGRLTTLCFWSSV